MDRPFAVRHQVQAEGVVEELGEARDRGRFGDSMPMIRPNRQAQSMYMNDRHGRMYGSR
jgi:hypothetical protein